MLFDVFSDKSSQKELFELLYELSGTVETDVVFERVSTVLLRRFAHTESVNIMMKDIADDWVVNSSASYTRAELLPDRV